MMTGHRKTSLLLRLPPLGDSRVARILLNEGDNVSLVGDNRYTALHFGSGGRLAA